MGENHLSQQPVPGTGLRNSATGAGRSAVPYLALHPMGFSVPPGLRRERWALTPPFHPYPALSEFAKLRRAKPMRQRHQTAIPTRSERAGRFVFCGTFRQTASRLPSRIYPDGASLRRRPSGYAASRPQVFGLSSLPGLAGRAILRPSKISRNIGLITT